jgi:hypothetical protein
MLDCFCSQLSVGSILAAYIIYLLGNGLASWAVSANPFFHRNRACKPIATRP